MKVWIHQYIATLSPAEYQIHLLLIIIFLGFLLYKNYQTYQRFRFISDTPTSKIASAAQGYVELKGLGELISGPEIISPFSQRRCLWYQCILERRQRLNKHTIWVEESNQISDHIFHLQDDSGQCIVIPDGAQVIPSIKNTWYGSHSGIKNQTPHGRFKLQKYIGIGRYRFTEKLIMVADELYVIGTFKSVQKNVHPETVKQRVEELVTMWKQNPVRYLIDFDRDKNGKIQKDEWKLIRQHAESEVLKRYRNTVHHTIEKPAESNQPFVISSIPEQQIIQKNKRLIGINFVIFFVMLYILITAVNVPLTT